MKIIVDGVIYSTYAGGIANYFDEILPRVSLFPDTQVEVILPRSAVRAAPSGGDISVKQSILPKVKFGLAPLRRTLSPLRKRVEDARWKFKTRRQTESIFHSTYFTEFANKNIPTVVTVHDMNHERLREFFSHENDRLFCERKARCIRNATSLIAVSENTKSELCDFFSIDPTRVRVIYHGVDHRTFYDVRHQPREREILKKYGIDRDYIFYVGGRWGYKNFQKLTEAFSIGRLKKSHQLVAAGQTWSEEETTHLKNLGIYNQCRLVHFPDKSVLRALYSFSSAFIYPSLAEGFGMPLLEAMACGAPVAASGTSCFPEIAGDAALYFDPVDPTAISRALETITDSQVADSFRARGVAHLLDKKFSWDFAAQQTWDVYRSSLPAKSQK
jgi:glycosyltransferase involved in cell wall biosynthesis